MLTYVVQLAASDRRREDQKVPGRENPSETLTPRSGSAPLVNNKGLGPEWPGLESAQATSDILL